MKSIKRMLLSKQDKGL